MACSPLNESPPERNVGVARKAEVDDGTVRGASVAFIINEEILGDSTGAPLRQVMCELAVYDAERIADCVYGRSVGVAAEVVFGPEATIAAIAAGSADRLVDTATVCP